MDKNTQYLAVIPPSGCPGVISLLNKNAKKTCTESFFLFLTPSKSHPKKIRKHQGVFFDESGLIVRSNKIFLEPVLFTIENNIITDTISINGLNIQDVLQIMDCDK